MASMTEQGRALSTQPKLEKELKFTPTPTDLLAGVGSAKGQERTSSLDGALLWLARWPAQYNVPRPVASSGSSTLRTGKDIIVLKASQAVPEAFQILIDHNILSAPVVDPVNRYIGFIDYIDLVLHTIRSFGLWLDTAEPGKRSSFPIWQRYIGVSDFRQATVNNVMQKAWGPWRLKKAFHPVMIGSSMLYVMEMIATSGAHRIAVLDANAKICGLVTQSMVINLLGQELDRFGSIKDISIADMCASSALLNPHPEGVLAVRSNSIAKDAFEKMVDNQVFGLAVVNEAGVLVDSVSIHDLRGIGSDAAGFHLLYDSVAQFKKECARLFPQQTVNKPVYVQPNDTFGKLIKCMQDGNIHRVFVCDLNESGQPIPKRVITQRDVIKFLLASLGLPICRLEIEKSCIPVTA